MVYTLSRHPLLAASAGALIGISGCLGGGRTRISPAELSGEATRTIDQLEPSSEIDVETSFDAVERDDMKLTVRAADGEGDVATGEAELTVVNKSDALDLARDRIADLLESLPQGGNDSNGSRTTSVRKRTQSVRYTLDRTASALDSGNQRQAKNQLNAAEKQITTLREILSRSDNSGAESSTEGDRGKNHTDSNGSLNTTVKERAAVRLAAALELIRLACVAEV